jgi:hypothetical protein
VVVARTARGLVGDIEPGPLQLGVLIPCRMAKCIRNSATRRHSEVTYPIAFKVSTLFIAGEEALLLGEELPERLAVPAVRAAPAAEHFEYSVVRSAEAELALCQCAGFIRDCVPRRSVLHDLGASSCG